MQRLEENALFKYGDGNGNDLEEVWKLQFFIKRDKRKSLKKKRPKEGMEYFPRILC